MKKYKYKSYDDYVKAQKAAFNKKYKNIWAKEENIKAIAIEILKKRNPERGLCHGVRQGWEIIWFEKYLRNCIVWGTDIGDPVCNFVFQFDFNLPAPEWVKKFDFLYSNSFDHAFNPEKTFNIWVNQVKPGGVIILEYDRRQEHTGEISKAVNKTDPVSIRFKELIKFVKKWNTRVKNVYTIDMPVVTQEWRKAVFIEV